MINRFFTFTFATLFTFSSFSMDRNLEHYGVSEESAKRNPIVQCPASDSALKDLRKKLLDLKVSISKKAKCSGFRSEASTSIDGLADLITTDRDNFLNLITKGQVEGLSESDSQSIQNYITNLTVKSSNLLSILSGEDACFDEDKKGQTADFITSLIGEASKVLSVIGGPQIGGLVSIASNVITGFSEAISIINENKVGYDFSVPEQKIAFADSLCALFEYRRELDNLMNPYETTERLEQLMASVNKQLSKLQKNCVECAALIAKVDARTANATDDGVLEIEKVDQIWSPRFEQNIALEAKKIDQLYTNKVGTHTFKALKTRNWLPLRIRAVENSALVADLGLLDVLIQIDNVERFLVDRQAGKFLDQMIKDSETARYNVDRYLSDEASSLAYELEVMPEEFWTGNWTKAEEAYEIYLEGLQVASRSKDRLVRSKLKSFAASFVLKSKTLNATIDVSQNYCKFFENSNWYRGNIPSKCPNKALVRISEDALFYTNLLINYFPEYRGDISLPESTSQTAGMQMSVDWIDSLRSSIDDMSRRSDYVVRQSKPYNNTNL